MTKTKIDIMSLAHVSASAVVGAVIFAAAVMPAGAAGEQRELKEVNFTFEGPFGTFDRGQLQRGYKVYEQVCSGCHSLDLLSFRNLAEEGGPGFSPAQARVLAAEFPRQVLDGPDAFGDMFERPGKPSDRFPPPFVNEAAARASNSGAYPPDFSVLAKAREGGADYIYSLLTGYEEPPAHEEIREGMYYNPYFPGHQIAMAPPLSDDVVEYTDGAPMTVDQYSKDVASFMMWAAEPKLEERKRIGFQVMVFLIVLAGLLYFTKQKLWRNIDH
ncbi:cytochrome c1 [Microbaculum marinum]|uniref:Cytochrome c1 n=1 Tax=Microbaculum marinum TaxID=1764581 RepID=A0AAW9RXC1_9HYPH